MNVPQKLQAAINSYNTAATRFLDDPDELNRRAARAAQRYLDEAAAKHGAQLSYTHDGRDQIARSVSLVTLPEVRP